MVLPRLLYRTECLPLTPDHTLALAKVMERFVLGVLGLPTLVAKKTLYTHCSHGLGLGFFPVLHPTRVLDVLHCNQHIQNFTTTAHGPLSPYTLFKSSVSMLGPPIKSSMLLLDITWEGKKLIRNATSVVSIAGLSVYLVPSISRPDCTFTDGSKIGSPPAS